MKNPIMAMVCGCLLIGLLVLAGCGKSKPAQVKADPNADALTKGQELIASHQAAPQDLTNSYTTPASYFDKITQFPAWKTVPRGEQFFAGVPLNIGGMMCLWGELNATKQHLIFPESILGITLNQKFETLYVYHGAFHEGPDGTPVCSVVLRYDDGSSATNVMRYGEDMLDWRSNNDGQPVVGPTAERSRLAWVGGSFSPAHPEPLRLCLTAIENPQPDLLVKTVDLYSSKGPVTACVMAMTPGKKGLMEIKN